MKRRFLVITISIITICLIGLFAYSITNNANRTLQNELLKMQGKPINLDVNNAEVYYNGVDTIYKPC